MKAANPHPKCKILSEKWLKAKLPPERFSWFAKTGREECGHDTYR